LGPIWRLKQSQLYALLTKLEKDGYIWGELEPQAAAARPPRRMYQLTITGQTAYQNWLRTPVNVPRLMRQEFMAKYYFARLEGPAQVKALIDTQRATCLHWLEKLHVEQTTESAFSQVVSRYRLGQMEAALAWLDACQQDQ
jgi:DNA-binding PadR family transcriptional regulator